MANLTTKDYFNQESIQKKFQELMGSRANQFITSVLQTTYNNSLLAKADPASIYGAAVTAAVLDLPINNNFGFAYIVPYGGAAQFQIGYKGIIQLALRSGQFKSLSSCPVYEGQLISSNPLTGYEFDFNVPAKGEPIGYAAYFKLLNGFERYEYMSKEECEKHGKKFSKQYGGVWTTNFDAMAQKTVVKRCLKYAPLSIEIQRAIIADQSVSTDGETFKYPDNPLDKSEKASAIFDEAEDVTPTENI